ncbi:MAG TPA: hypothetical protein VHI54_02405 [Actinomycetota bacterium]|nr:hypothetical protein [Actinomycetota bacterium]
MRKTTLLWSSYLNGSRKSKRAEVDGYHMIRLTEEGKVAEGFTGDKDALDESHSESLSA